MKTFKMICMTAIVVSALSIPGLGGELNSPGFTEETGNPPISQPSPEPTTNDPSLSQAGDLSTPELMAILLTLSALF